MAVFHFSEEFKSSIPPSRLWKAAVVDIHNLLPKIAPQFVASMEIVQGDGGVGTVKVTKFTQAVEMHSEVKSRTEAIDEANFYFKYSIVDQRYEVWCYEYKFSTLEDGGSLCKLSGEYKAAADYEPTEEERNGAKENPIRALKGIEAYLQANPDAYA